MLRRLACRLNPRNTLSIPIRITESDINAAVHSSSEHLQQFPLNSGKRRWTEIDVVAREKWCEFFTTTALTYPPKRNIAEAQKTSDETVIDRHSPSLFWGTFFSVSQVMDKYETLVGYALKLGQFRRELELRTFPLRDALRLKRCSAQELASKQRELEALVKEMGELEAEKTQYAAKYFDTSVYNSLINLMRLFGETNPHATSYALQILDDMTALSIPFDETTQLLLRSLTFGDDDSHNSDALFSLVEFPEMGQVTNKLDSVEKLARDSIRTISRRHNLPITEGAYQQDKGTHPLLPRTPEGAEQEI